MARKKKDKKGTKEEEEVIATPLPTKPEISLDSSIELFTPGAPSIPGEEDTQPLDTPSQPRPSTLDEAVEDAKRTASALQGLLSKVSEGEGFYKRAKDQELAIEPQLTYESKTQIAQDYMMEDVPLSERSGPSSVRPRPSFIDAENIIDHQAEGPLPPPGPPPSALPVEALPLEPEPPKEEDIYQKLANFFEAFMNGYNERYQRWENSISNILAILRKMRKITKKNTEDLVNTITNQYDIIRSGLEQFKMKRDEIEKVAGVNIESMSSEFKRVLGLLELQIKEYQLKKESDILIRDMRIFSG